MPHLIETLPKGCVPQPLDERDFHAGFVLGAPNINWQKGFRLSEPPDEDQGSSLSCVSQAWSYYHWQINRKEWSRRDIYSQIYLPQGGAYLRDGGRIIKEKGQCERHEAPDPKNQTEANMRVRDDINPSLALDGQERSYYSVNAKSPDALAQAIIETGGVIFGVQGSNAGWADMMNPRPPKYGESVWGHAIMAFGFHLHDGQKCIIAKSSWCRTGVKEHHIKQNYFDSGDTFDGWCLIPKETISMVKRYIVNKHGKLGVCVSVDGEGVFSDVIYWAKSEQHLQQLKAMYEVPANAPVINYP